MTGKQPASPHSAIAPNKDDERDVPRRVRRILASRGLTLSQVSAKSRSIYPNEPRYHVPHNFYYQLRLPGFSPTIHHVIALSKISNYWFSHWLRIFGFRLDDLPGIQIALPAQRTSLLESTVHDSEALVGWFKERTSSFSPSAIAPASQLLVRAPARRAHSFLSRNGSSFIYVKVGRQDALAFPELLPGSVVRADTRWENTLLAIRKGQTSRRLFLIEHSKGLTCCRVHVGGTNRITLLSRDIPYAQVELQVGREARVLGVLDLEIRPVGKITQPRVPRDLASYWQPQTLLSSSTPLSLPRILQRSRLRAGLAFREASAHSRYIAQMLGNEKYFCAPGTLSDYEALSTLPRHLHKVISLCALYSMGFLDILNAAGLRPQAAGQDPIPDHLLDRPKPHGETKFRDSTEEDGKNQGFFAHLIEEVQEVPIFLRGSIGVLTGLEEVSLRDVFWIGGQRLTLHPYLKNALFVVVNRRHKKPTVTREIPAFLQPVYILVQRDGTYLCTGCSLENQTLIAHPFSDGFQRPERFINRVDAEVVGQVTAIVRRLS